MKTCKVDGIEIPVEKLEALGWTPPEEEVKTFLEDGEYYYYLDREEAEKDFERKQVIGRVLRKLRELEGDWKVDWNDDNQYKYHPSYAHDEKQFYVISRVYNQHIPSEWYSTYDAWCWVIENMESEVKLMLGVK